MNDLNARVRALELLKKTRFGIVTEIDNSGTADWNTKSWKPAARVLIQDTKEVEITCRFESVGAGKDEGIWWPLKKGAIVRVAFQKGIDTGSITGRFWSDDQSDIPSEARTEGDNVVVKYAGHTIIIDGKAGDGGISLKTASGIEIDAQDKSGDQKLSITHPSGTNIEIDNAGNVSLECVGNLEAGIDGNAEITIGGDLETIVIGNVDADIGGNASISVGGDLDVQVAGRSLINSGGVNELRSAAEILLKTASAATGMLTQATHPVCTLTGIPIGVSGTVKGSS